MASVDRHQLLQGCSAFRAMPCQKVWKFLEVDRDRNSEVDGCHAMPVLCGSAGPTTGMDDTALLCSEFVQDVEFLERTCRVGRCNVAAELSKILEVFAVFGKTSRKKTNAHMKY